MIIPVTTTKIDKKGKIISVRTQSLTEYSFKTFSFNEIAGFIYVNETTDPKGFKEYQLIMPLKDDTKIELSTRISMDEDQFFSAAELMNGCIFDSSGQGH